MISHSCIDRRLIRHRFRWIASVALLTLLLIMQAVAAQSLYRCDTPEGIPLFANVPCGPDSEPLDLPEIGQIGSDDDGEALRRRTEALARIAGIEPQRPAPVGSKGLSFGERMTLRKLEIRRDGLLSDINKRALTSSYRKSLNDELVLVNRRIRELESKR